MKLFFIVFSCFVINTIQAQPSPVVLTGTISKSSSPEIFVNRPVGKSFFTGAAQRFTMDTLTGIYNIKLNIDRPMFIKVTNNWHTVKMYVEPGKAYTWNTQFKKSGNIDDFQGYQSEVNTLLNTIAATPDSKMVDIGLFEAPTFAKKQELLQKALAQKIAPVNKLLKEGKVSNTFYKDFLNEINIWGKDVLSTYYFFAFRETDDGQNKEKAADFKKNYLPDWDRLYKHVNDSLQWQSATSYASFLNRYAAYREIKETGTLTFGSDYFSRDWQYVSAGLRGGAREQALANLIYDLYAQNEYDKEKLFRGMKIL